MPYYLRVDGQVYGPIPDEVTPGEAAQNIRRSEGRDVAEGFWEELGPNLGAGVGNLLSSVGRLPRAVGLGDLAAPVFDPLAEVGDRVVELSERRFSPGQMRARETPGIQGPDVYGAVVQSAPMLAASVATGGAAAGAARLAGVSGGRAAAMGATGAALTEGALMAGGAEEGILQDIRSFATMDPDTFLSTEIGQRAWERVVEEGGANDEDAYLRAIDYAARDAAGWIPVAIGAGGVAISQLGRAGLASSGSAFAAQLARIPGVNRFVSPAVQELLDASARFVGSNAATRIGGVVANRAVGEGLEETAQSVMEQAGLNLAVGRVDPTRTMGQGLGEAAILGGIAGGITGGGFGAFEGGLSEFRNRRAQPPDTEDLDDWDSPPDIGNDSTQSPDSFPAPPLVAPPDPVFADPTAAPFQTADARRRALLRQFAAEIARIPGVNRFVSPTAPAPAPEEPVAPPPQTEEAPARQRAQQSGDAPTQEDAISELVRRYGVDLERGNYDPDAYRDDIERALRDVDVEGMPESLVNEAMAASRSGEPEAFLEPGDDGQAPLIVRLAPYRVGGGGMPQERPQTGTDTETSVAATPSEPDQSEEEYVASLVQEYPDLDSEEFTTAYLVAKQANLDPRIVLDHARQSKREMDVAPPEPPPPPTATQPAEIQIAREPEPAPTPQPPAPTPQPAAAATAVPVDPISDEEINRLSGLQDAANAEGASEESVAAYQGAIKAYGPERLKAAKSAAIERDRGARSPSVQQQVLSDAVSDLRKLRSAPAAPARPTPRPAAPVAQQAARTNVPAVVAPDTRQPIPDDLRAALSDYQSTRAAARRDNNPRTRAARDAAATSLNQLARRYGYRPSDARIKPERQVAEIEDQFIPNRYQNESAGRAVLPETQVAGALAPTATAAPQSSSPKQALIELGLSPDDADAVLFGDRGSSSEALSKYSVDVRSKARGIAAQEQEEVNDDVNVEADADFISKKAGRGKAFTEDLGYAKVSYDPKSRTPYTIRSSPQDDGAANDLFDELADLVGEGRVSLNPREEAGRQERGQADAATDEVDIPGREETLQEDAPEEAAIPDQEDSESPAPAPSEEEIEALATPFRAAIDYGTGNSTAKFNEWASLLPNKTDEAARIIRTKKSIDTKIRQLIREYGIDDSKSALDKYIVKLARNTTGSGSEKGEGKARVEAAKADPIGWIMEQSNKRTEKGATQPAVEARNNADPDQDLPEQTDVDLAANLNNETGRDRAEPEPPPAEPEGGAPTEEGPTVDPEEEAAIDAAKAEAADLKRQIDESVGPGGVEEIVADLNNVGTDRNAFEGIIQYLRGEDIPMKVLVEVAQTYDPDIPRKRSKEDMYAAIRGAFEAKRDEIVRRTQEYIPMAGVDAAAAALGAQPYLDELTNRGERSSWEVVEQISNSLRERITSGNITTARARAILGHMQTQADLPDGAQGALSVAVQNLIEDPPKEGMDSDAGQPLFMAATGALTPTQRADADKALADLRKGRIPEVRSSIGSYSQAEAALLRMTRQRGPGNAWRNEFKRQGVPDETLNLIFPKDFFKRPNVLRREVMGAIANAPQMRRADRSGDTSPAKLSDIIGAVSRQGRDALQILKENLQQTDLTSIRDIGAYFRLSGIIAADFVVGTRADIEESRSNRPNYSEYALSGGQDYRVSLYHMDPGIAAGNYENHHFNKMQGLVFHTRSQRWPFGRLIEETQSFLHMIGAAAGYDPDGTKEVARVAKIDRLSAEQLELREKIRPLRDQMRRGNTSNIEEIGKLEDRLGRVGALIRELSKAVPAPSDLLANTWQEKAVFAEVVRAAEDGELGIWFTSSEVLNGQVKPMGTSGENEKSEEGGSQLYDTIIPAQLRKAADQYGARYEERQVTVRDKKGKAHRVTVRGFRLNEPLRDRIAQRGFPLFMASGPFDGETQAQQLARQFSRDFRRRDPNAEPREEIGIDMGDAQIGMRTATPKEMIVRAAVNAAKNISRLDNLAPYLVNPKFRKGEDESNTDPITTWWDAYTGKRMTGDYREHQRTRALQAYNRIVQDLDGEGRASLVQNLQQAVRDGFLGRAAASEAIALAQEPPAPVFDERGELTRGPPIWKDIYIDVRDPAIGMELSRRMRARLDSMNMQDIPVTTSPGNLPNPKTGELYNNSVQAFYYNRAIALSTVGINFDGPIADVEERVAFRLNGEVLHALIDAGVVRPEEMDAVNRATLEYGFQRDKRGDIVGIKRVKDPMKSIQGEIYGNSVYRAQMAAVGNMGGVLPILVQEEAATLAFREQRRLRSLGKTASFTPPVQRFMRKLGGWLKAVVAAFKGAKTSPQEVFLNADEFFDAVVRGEIGLRDRDRSQGRRMSAVYQLDKPLFMSSSSAPPFDVSATYNHPDLGEVLLPVGNRKFGRRHIDYKHSDNPPDLTGFASFTEVRRTDDGKYIDMSDGENYAVVATDYAGQPRNWIVTAYKVDEPQRGWSARGESNPSQGGNLPRGGISSQSPPGGAPDFNGADPRGAVNRADPDPLFMASENESGRTTSGGGPSFRMESGFVNGALRSAVRAAQRVPLIKADKKSIQDLGINQEEFDVAELDLFLRSAPVDPKGRVRTRDLVDWLTERQYDVSTQTRKSATQRTDDEGVKPPGEPPERARWGEHVPFRADQIDDYIEGSVAFKTGAPYQTEFKGHDFPAGTFGFYQAVIRTRDNGEREMVITTVQSDYFDRSNKSTVKSEEERNRTKDLKAEQEGLLAEMAALEGQLTAGDPRWDRYNSAMSRAFELDQEISRLTQGRNIGEVPFAKSYNKVILKTALDEAARQGVQHVVIVDRETIKSMQGMETYSGKLYDYDANDIEVSAQRFIASQTGQTVEELEQEQRLRGWIEINQSYVPRAIVMGFRPKEDHTPNRQTGLLTSTLRKLIGSVEPTPYKAEGKAKRGVTGISFELRPARRDDILENGFPLFMAAHPTAPADTVKRLFSRPKILPGEELAGRSAIDEVKEVALAMEDPFLVRQASKRIASAIVDQSDRLASSEYAALRWVGNLVDSAFVLGNLPAQDLFIALRARAGALAMRAQEYAERLTKLRRQMSEEDLEQFRDYMITRNADPDQINSTDVREAAIATKEIFNLLGVENTRIGRMTQAQLRKYKDRYLPRAYWKYIEKELRNRGIKVGTDGFLKQRGNGDQRLVALAVQQIGSGEQTELARREVADIMTGASDAAWERLGTYFQTGLDADLANVNLAGGALPSATADRIRQVRQDLQAIQDKIDAEDFFTLKPVFHRVNPSTGKKWKNKTEMHRFGPKGFQKRFGDNYVHRMFVEASKSGQSIGELYESEAVNGVVTDPILLSIVGVQKQVRSLAVYKFMDQIFEAQSAVDEMDRAAGREPRNLDWIRPGTLISFRDKKYGRQVFHELLETTRQNRQLFRDGSLNKVIADEMVAEMEVEWAKAESAYAGTKRSSRQYARLPDTDDYGNMRGVEVHRSIYKDFVGAAGQIKAGEGGALTDFEDRTAKQVLSFFKQTKTTLNLFGGHVRAILGNMANAYTIGGVGNVAAGTAAGLASAPFMGGVSVIMAPTVAVLPSYISTLRDIQANSDDWQEALGRGIKLGTFTEVELRNSLQVLAEIRDQDITDPSRAMKVLRKLGLAVTGAMTTAANAYNFWDTTTRYMVYREAVKKGIGKTDALLLATQVAPDYSLVPDWVRSIRSNAVGFMAAPFATWAFKMSPSILDIAARAGGHLKRREIPSLVALALRTAPVFALVGGLAQLASYLLLGFDDDEEREAYEATLVQGYRDNITRLDLPIKNSLGEYQSITLDWLFAWNGPLQAISHLSRGEIGKAASTGIGFGNPILGASIGAVSGQDLFSGQRLYDEAATDGVKIAASLNHMLNQLVAPPPLVGMFDPIFGAMGYDVRSPYQGWASLATDKVFGNGISNSGKYVGDWSAITGRALGFNVVNHDAQRRSQSEYRRDTRDISNIGRMIGARERQRDSNIQSIMRRPDISQREKERLAEREREEAARDIAALEERRLQARRERAEGQRTRSNLQED